MGPDPLIISFEHLLTGRILGGPVLDLACGDGRNGLRLASQGLPVVLADRSRKAVDAARRSAEERGIEATFWEVDLEAGGANPLVEDHYGAILVFRYLHRPLMPCIRKALRNGGVLLYETFTVDQPKYGMPHNPDFLLHLGELKIWFRDWHLIHYFEGVLQDPQRAVAQIVCEKST